jgi:hypothetical protein
MRCGATPAVFELYCRALPSASKPQAGRPRGAKGSDLPLPTPAHREPGQSRVDTRKVVWAISQASANSAANEAGKRFGADYQSAQEGISRGRNMRQGLKGQRRRTKVAELRAPSGVKPSNPHPGTARNNLPYKVHTFDKVYNLLIFLA